MDELIVKYTKLIHPEDLGAETSRLEDILRMFKLDVEIQNTRLVINKLQNNGKET